MRARIILDNGGGLVLQIGEWAHNYWASTTEQMCQQAATDIAEYLRSGTTEDWEGHDDDATLVDPTTENIRNGEYRVVDLDALDDLADDKGHTEATLKIALRQTGLEK